MSTEADLPYAEISELEAKVVAIPYEGDRLSMIILLPNERDGLSKMENLLKNFDLTTLSKRFRNKKVSLQMPKFKLESSIDLTEPLAKLGMGSMFDQTTADFSGIPQQPLKNNLYVSKAIQKAFIEVNEEGSEAAAATGVLVQLKSAIVQRVTQFPVDHPFIGFISDEATGSIMFMTTVENPLNEQTTLRTQLKSTGDGPAGNSGPAEKKMQWGLLSLGLLYFLQFAL